MTEREPFSMKELVEMTHDPQFTGDDTRSRLLRARSWIVSKKFVEAFREELGAGPEPEGWNSYSIVGIPLVVDRNMPDDIIIINPGREANESEFDRMKRIVIVKLAPKEKPCT